VLFLGGGVPSAQGVELTWEYSVQVSAKIALSPPAIFLMWPQDMATAPTNYVIWRKRPEETSWGEPVFLPGSSTDFLDTNIETGVAYEYQILKETSTHVGYGYICAGIGIPAIEERGIIILLVDQTCAPSLSAELARLQQDLAGDGWTVWRHDVARDGDVTGIKALIQADYALDPANVKAVFLFGRVPVPYSGDCSPDGHPTEHMGAWPADVFYGQLDGTWTDSSVTDKTASNARNWNIPGDGKFDQSEIPGLVQLQVGRVDFANMPGRDTNDIPTFPGETELLRRYLDKDHAYRHRLFQVPTRGLVFNETGDRAGEAFASDAWRNYAPLLSPPPALPLQYYQFLPILQTNAYLWAYATAGSTMRQMSGLGGNGGWNKGGMAPDFVKMDAQAVFGMMLGSWLGDWDGEDNLMRALLATPSCGLACVYAGRPHWFFHYMGIGETLGYCLRLTQNNHANGLYQNQSNAYPGFVHIALMGDPTLRLYPVAPPSGLVAACTPAGAELAWGRSADAVAGYYVYSSTNPAGPFKRLTPSLLQTTNFVDPSGSVGPVTYMVRAIKLQNCPSGSFYNLSQGVVSSTLWPPLQVKLIPSTDTLLLSWGSMPSVSYRIYYSDSLQYMNWTAASGDILADSTTTCWTNTVSWGAGSGFYKVEKAAAVGLGVGKHSGP
jgi:hypothetical protein